MEGQMRVIKDDDILGQAQVRLVSKTGAEY
jgi:hypothetical protein